MHKIYNMEFKFQGRQYSSDQGWGEAHPKYAYWFNPECINVSNGVLTLDINDTAKHGKSFGAGEAVSKKNYLYGTFEWRYKLPVGRHLWPALWLTGANTWPPEIDVIEGWTSKGFICPNRRDYKRLFSNVIVPGIFYKPEDKVLHVNIKSTAINLQPIDAVNKCRLEWYPDIISISYNDKEVFKVTDKKILEYFNQPMKVIMNNAVTEKFTVKDYDDYKKNGRPLKILSFMYHE